MTKSIFVAICLFVFFCICTVSAQKKRCFTDEHYAKQILKDPSFEHNRLLKEAEISRILNGQKNKNSVSVTIPVVFHIVHNGDAVGVRENIADARVLAALDQLNDDYSRMNSDVGNTPAAFASLAGSTDIQFCLASVDENGNPTTGINRVNINTLSNVNQADCWEPDYISDRIVSPLIWDRDMYMNIFSLLNIDYVEDGECMKNSLLGFAQFPGGPANSDAAVHAYYTIGSLTMPNPSGGVYGFGRTVTHEVGHWLGLDHPWGPGFGGCNMDDSVADTPNAFEPTYGCPNFPLTDDCTSAGSGLMFMNYMDYVDDQCMNMFSQGQSNRMMASISAFRPNLLNGGCGANDCPETLTTTSNTISSGIYLASRKVSSDGLVSSNSDVRLTAKECVAMDVGFEVQNGGRLTVDVVGCN